MFYESVVTQESIETQHMRVSQFRVWWITCTVGSKGLIILASVGIVEECTARVPRWTFCTSEEVLSYLVRSFDYVNISAVHRGGDMYARIFSKNLPVNFLVVIFACRLLVRCNCDLRRSIRSELTVFQQRF